MLELHVKDQVVQNTGVDCGNIDGSENKSETGKRTALRQFAWRKPAVT